MTSRVPQEILRVLQERRDVAVEMLNAIPGVTCYSPEATFYLFPDVTGAMERVGAATTTTSVSPPSSRPGARSAPASISAAQLPGESRRYVRIAYSGIDVEQIREGLGLLRRWVTAGVQVRSI